MNKRLTTGWLVIFGLLVIGIFLWFASKPAEFSFADDPWKHFGQLAGILGTILISLEYILATRAKVFDKIFDGLDKAYVAHHFLGGLGFSLVLFHPIFLALNSPTFLSGLNLYFIPGGIFSYSLGIFALYAYAALIFITFYVRLPYEIWRKTHTLMGIPLIIATYHILEIGSDLGRYLPLKIFILGLVGMAFGSYVYRRFLYEKFSSKYEYKVSRIVNHGEISDIFMTPQGQKIQFTPGQFAFIRFNSEKITPELHPFSISSAPEEPELRISIKKLGDFTKILSNNLEPNTSATLYGPHGELGHKSLESKKPEVWIAGGIGITPFLSLLRYYASNKADKKISLIYCAKSADEFTYQNEIDSMAKTANLSRVTYYNSETDGQINGDKVEKIIGGLQDKKIFLCGPTGMMTSLTEAFLAQKIHPRNIVFEDFSFK